MNSSEIRDRFLIFFKERGHKILPSSSLLPTDPTVLFTTAGMQRLSLYLSGEKDVLKEFGNRHLASSQKCFRTGDIEEIGDDTHHTFFEMLGNWSVGQDKDGYFKEGAINYAFDFVINVLKLEKKRIWITIFKGNENIPKDEESREIWIKKGIPRERILEFGEEDNLWGPVKDYGPCGPTTEIHYDRGSNFGCKDCKPNCSKCNRFVEIWNLVFMGYYKEEEGFKNLPHKSVDTGAGLERMAAILQEKPSAYETDLFIPVIREIEKITGNKYLNNKEKFRILADHLRGAVFLIAEGVNPSNVDRGYILRRILRRSLCVCKSLEMPENSLITLSRKVIDIYKDIYPDVQKKQIDIFTVLQKEEEKFGKALCQKEVIKELEEIEKEWDIPKVIDRKSYINSIANKLFFLWQSCGCPPEYVFDELEKKTGKKNKLREDITLKLEDKIKKHKEISRAGAKKKFGGVGEDATKEAIKLHTATHLLHQSLREVLGDHVRQMGSDINSERLRFDFTHPEKMAKEELEKVESIVNRKIKQDLKVEKEEMPYKKAIDSGALAFFKEKYPEKVKVYSVGDFSKEVCAGPHVKRTSELGIFKIIKEKSVGAGVRRIRAILK